MPDDPADSLPLLVDRARFAAELGVCVRTLDVLISKGRLPAPDVRLSRKLVRWRAQTVRDAVEQLAGEIAGAR